MLTRTPTASNPPSAGSSPTGPRLIAAGRLSAGTRELRAPSYFEPRRDEVEHRVSQWHPGCWVAEVRVNLRMTHHSIFRGENAYADAVAWCEAIAPHADYIRLHFPPIHDGPPAVAADALAALFAEAAL